MQVQQTSDRTAASLHSRKAWSECRIKLPYKTCVSDEERRVSDAGFKLGKDLVVLANRTVWGQERFRDPHFTMRTGQVVPSSQCLERSYTH